MGVKDLWQLLAPIGRRVSIETLEGKVLAIDMSIWITQFIKAMRDDEGKMVRNAHIIGTIRRILRLLFHKIRPVFVFDGETPAIKARVVKQRRKVHERHESNRKAAVHKMILSQLKQKLLEEMQKGTDNTSNRTKVSNLVPTFNLPDNECNNPTKAMPSSSQDQFSTSQGAFAKNDITKGQEHVIDLENADDIQWEEHNEIKPKSLHDDEEDANASSDGEEPSFDIPDNYDELNSEVLSSLPTYIRKRIIEDARRKERIKSRARYIPVAEDPSLYSQTQLANFLVTTKLNKRFEEAQKLIDGSTDDSKRIAAEGNKRYRLVQNSSMVTTTSSVQHTSVSGQSEEQSELEKDDDDGVEYDGSWMHDEDSTDERESKSMGTSQPQSSSAPPRGGGFLLDDMDDRTLFIQPSKRQQMKDRLAELGCSNNSTSISSSMKRQRKMKSPEEVDWMGLPFVEQASKAVRFAEVETQYDSFDKGMNKIHEKMLISTSLDGSDHVNSDEESETTGFFIEPSTTATTADASKPDDITLLAMKMQASSSYSQYSDEKGNKDSESGFYRDFHTMDDEDDQVMNGEDLEDIQWETGSATDTTDIINIQNETSTDPSNNEDQEYFVATSGTTTEIDVDEILISDVVGNEQDDIESTTNPVKLEETATISTEALEVKEDPPLDMISPSKSRAPVSGSVLDRAVETASSMADWAGRAVRRALKDLKPSQSRSDHVTTSAQANGVTEPSTTVEFHLDDEYLNLSVNVATGSLFTDSQSVPTTATVGSKPVSSSSSSSFYALPEIPDSGGGFLSMYNETYDMDEEARKAYLASSRDAEKMTEEMKEDVMKLIQAFDLPFLIAPFEAEAQCAVLEELGLVDGIITEDSDAFLFGAKSVYKNIFSDKKFVEVYLTEDAKRELGLTRDDLIALAYFLGSDYTEGVHGVGIVNAMEIIHAFPMKVESGGPMAGLEKFRNWLKGYDFAKEILAGLEQKRRKALGKQKSSKRVRGKSPESKVKHHKSSKSESIDDSSSSEEDNTSGGFDDAESEALDAQLTHEEEKLVSFDTKHKSGRAKWTVPESFPDPKVAQAYYHPDTNRSTDPFFWSDPSRDKVSSYCRNILGWSEDQIKAQIDPVLRSFSERTTQTRIDSHFMTYHDDNRFAKIASDRLRNAVVQITGKSSSLSIPKEVSEKKRKRSSKSN